MPRYAVDDHHFDLTLNVQCRMPAHPKRVILPAVRAALRGLPKRVLSKKLKSREPYALGVALVGPRAMQRLNGSFRKKDTPTDVLSFSRIEGDPTPHPEVGDVILCWEVAERQAHEYQTTVEEELCRLTIHGVLHLFGYDHEKSRKEAKRMFALQDRILGTLRPSAGRGHSPKTGAGAPKPSKKKVAKKSKRR